MHVLAADDEAVSFLLVESNLARGRGPLPPDRRWLMSAGRMPCLHPHLPPGPSEPKSPNVEPLLDRPEEPAEGVPERTPSLRGWPRHVREAFSDFVPLTLVMGGDS